MVSHHAAEPRAVTCTPRASDFSHRTSGSHVQPIPLARRAIFFYDLPDRVLPGVVGDLHHAPSPRRWTKKFATHLLAPTFRPVRHAASCHNSSGFLAAPYVGCDSSGILWRADRRSIFEARRQRISSTTDQGRQA